MHWILNDLSWTNWVMVENLEEINSVCSWEIIQYPTHKLEVTLFLISVYARLQLHPHNYDLIIVSSEYWRLKIASFFFARRIPGLLFKKRVKIAVHSYFYLLPGAQVLLPVTPPPSLTRPLTLSLVWILVNKRNCFSKCHNFSFVNLLYHCRCFI